MKKFIFETALFISIVAIIFATVLLQADGYTDPFYKRFTSSRQNNLILGTSRSAQALQPEVFQDILGIEFFNFSFTIAHSPFGPVYLESIKKKINPESKNGIHIVSIDPWSISNKGDHPNNVLDFPENELALAKVNEVNLNPNFEYLLKQFKGKYLNILFRRDYRSFLHEDGWLEVNVAMDSAIVKKRLDEKIISYRSDNLPNRRFSRMRLIYLEETIQFLKQHGRVFLVRLPISPEMFQIEQELMPDFNEKINKAILMSDGYYDFSPRNHLYQYTDGNHLWKNSGKVVSGEIAAWINSKTN